MYKLVFGLRILLAMEIYILSRELRTQWTCRCTAPQESRALSGLCRKPGHPHASGVDENS